MRGPHPSHWERSTSPTQCIDYCLVVTAQPGMTPEMTWPLATAMLEPDAQYPRSVPSAALPLPSQDVPFVNEAFTALPFVSRDREPVPRPPHTSV
ncbi:hypothetical protein BMERY_1953, partial [Bifidobacterium merycicum]